VLDLWVHHGAQRSLLQVLELWNHEWVRVASDFATNEDSRKRRKPAPRRFSGSSNASLWAHNGLIAQSSQFKSCPRKQIRKKGLKGTGRPFR
jgi:hypothetical protein